MRGSPFKFFASVACLLIISGCEEGAGSSVNTAPVSAQEEGAKLRSLGFRRTAQTQDGTTVFSYSGPVTSAVVCKTGNGPYAQLQPRSRSSDGTRTTNSLDAYLQLSPGSDGIISVSERSGVYAVNVIKRTPDGRTIKNIERITFAPDRTGTSKSGLTCRAA